MIVRNYIIRGLLPVYCISVKLEFGVCILCHGDGSHSRMRELVKDKIEEVNSGQTMNETLATEK